MPTLYEVVNYHSYAEFMSVYNSSDASLIINDLLLRSLGNYDTTTRFAIASQLLDDGADPAAQYEIGHRWSPGWTSIYAIDDAPAHQRGPITRCPCPEPRTRIPPASG
ncbi:hypothetical protein HNP02_001214 [Mycobacterium sp. AZCC_0083]|nr:hypothetical protein [Mycobacterium sp. AZCC_0083]